MANSHMKRCSTLLINRRMQTKTAMRYHLTLVRMAIIKKSAYNKYQGLPWWLGVWRKGNPLTLLVGIKLVQPLWRIVWRFLKKLKLGLPYDPATTLSRHVSGENHNLKRYMHPKVYCSTYLQFPGHGSNLNVHQQRN